MSAISDTSQTKDSGSELGSVSGTGYYMGRCEKCHAGSRCLINQHKTCTVSCCWLTELLRMRSEWPSTLEGRAKDNRASELHK